MSSDMIIPGNSILYGRFENQLTPDDYEMNVNGAITPVIFEVPFEDNGRDLVVVNITFGLSGGKITEPGEFMALAALANGVEIAVHFRNGSEAQLIAPLQTNADIVNRAGGHIEDFASSNDDMMTGGLFPFYNVSVSPSIADYLSFTINDDLSALNVFHAYFRGYYKN